MNKKLIYDQIREDVKKSEDERANTTTIPLGQRRGITEIRGSFASQWDPGTPIGVGTDKRADEEAKK